LLRDRVNAFFDRLGVDDLAARELLTPDFTWWISGPGQIDDKFIEIGAAMAKHVVSPVRFRVVDMIVKEPVAFVEVEESATLMNGTAYTIMAAYRLTFGDDGLITTIREYTDTKGATEIWTPVLS
jgi:ketosteroid isomerase-like protein